MKTSDDFSDRVKRILAARVGYLCSNPECRVTTSGPQDNPTKAVNIGVAAHITAASLGGPRYDANLSAEERSSPSNGIWLCQNDAKSVDNDVVRFTVDVLKEWKTNAEAEARARLGKITAFSVGDLFMDVSVINEDESSWNRGEDTILRYALDRSANLIKIEAKLGYIELFKRGGPVGPLEYVMSPTYCPFKWDFPTLDFKVVNDRSRPLFLTEIQFDIEESRADETPLFAIKKDTQQRFAGELHLINEGWCDLTDLKIAFHLFPGTTAIPTDTSPPYPHSISMPLLKDHIEMDVVDAFRQEGVDIDGMILLFNGNWDQDVFVAQKADGSEERMNEAEMHARWTKYLGRFTTEVGTLVGEISFKRAAGAENAVKFSVPVYLANKNRMGILKPPSYKYSAAFDIQRTNYQERVAISHSLEPGESDRFTVKIAVAQSSFHRFRATLRDVSGLVWQSVPVEMSCFVPRSRRERVRNAITPAIENKTSEST